MAASDFNFYIKSHLSHNKKSASIVEKIDKIIIDSRAITIDLSAVRSMKTKTATNHKDT